MSVTTTANKIQYTLTTGSQALSVPFYFLDNAHIKAVTVATETLPSITLVLGTDYTLTGAGNPSGGTLTTIATIANGLAAGSKIVIKRNLPITQPTSYSPNDAFPAKVHEAALDRGIMLAQQIEEQADRAIRLPEDESGNVVLPPASERANKTTGFDSTGQNIAMKTPISGDGILETESVGEDALQRDFRSRAQPSVAAMKAQSYANAKTGDRVELQGYYARGDGGDGTFYVDKSDTTTADNGGTVIVANDGTRLKRLVTEDKIDAACFGVLDDTTSLNSAKIVSALSAVKTVVFNKRNTGIVKIDAQVSIPSNKNIIVNQCVTLKAISGLGASTPFVNSDSTGNISITGLGTIDCNDAYKAVALTNCPSCLFEDITVIGSVNSGEPSIAGAINLSGCVGTTLLNVKASKLGGCGLYAVNGSNTKVYGGSYTNCSTDSGIDLTTCPYSIVSGVIATGNAASGISINSTNSTVVGCISSGNQWGINVAHNAAIWSGSDSVVVGNTVFSNTAVGIQVQGTYTTGVIVASNRCTGNLANYNIATGTLAPIQVMDSLAVGLETPGLKLHVSGIQGAPQTSGTSQNGVARFQGAGSFGVLDVCVNGGTGSYLQATNSTDLSQTYPLFLNPNGGLVETGGPICPPTTAPAVQTAAQIFGGTGVPTNGIAPNGAFYFRSDGTAGTRIYHRESSVWVGIV